ncbi:Aquaporin-3 [Cichlidogyrus casuarinus]|uniref:Aquaporin-3 n=1 Tax=Cichlidogyrus casuarinus TaxID=1844966 RepID=A0ABD2Q706_9PLAT
MPTEDAQTSSKPTLDERLDVIRHTVANKMRLRAMPVVRECFAEFIGTAILIIFGCGVLAQVIVGDNGKGGHGDFMSISLGWGMAVMIGVFFSGGAGPGLINPAVTLAFAIVGKVKFYKVLPYTLSQLLGAFVGALLVLAIHYDGIVNLAERDNNGEYKLNHTGKIFVTMPAEGISNTACFVDQLFGTFLLASSALAITDKNNWHLPSYLHPFMIGMMIFTVVGAFGINAGAALNPARDLGPRLMIALCGWGTQSFTAYQYYFWIPIVGPYIGAIVGAIFYEMTIGIHLDEAGDPSLPKNFNDRVRSVIILIFSHTDSIGAQKNH